MVCEWRLSAVELTESMRACCYIDNSIVTCCCSSSLLGMVLFGGKFCSRVDDRTPCNCKELLQTNITCACSRKNFDTFVHSSLTVFQVQRIYWTKNYDMYKKSIVGPGEELLFLLLC